MKVYDTEKMLGQLKKVYVERVVKNGFEDSYLYNDQLMKLDDLALREFGELQKIIGITKAMPKTGDIDINSLGFTEEEFEQAKRLQKEKRELTAEEEEFRRRLMEARKNRDSAISILRGISIRMPLLIYGADLQKNLDGSEDAITIDNFTDLVDNLSWQEFMPNGVTKEKFNQFKKYYDSDVFREAGIRIREMAKAADRLCVEERIERISTIFGTFRNPDKETVLTPWRVVNMHLTESLGGWCFYDEKYREPITEPVFVEQNDSTKAVYRKNTRILEINSKSGLYALYCAYSVFRNRKKLELGPTATREQEKELWKKVLAENIYVICKTPMAKSITKRTLAGFTEARVNAHYFEDLVNQLKHKPDNFISKVTRSSYWKKDGEEMKFDAVVGNPPYQEMASGDANGSDPIYHLFIDVSGQIAEKAALIHPGRFLFNAGKTPKDWNKKILNNEHFKVVKYWANSADVFPTVDIKGGVAVTLQDKMQNFGKIGIFVAHPELNAILGKVKVKDFTSFADLVYPAESYNFTKKLHQDYPDIEKKLSKGHLYDLKSPVLEKLPEIFLSNPLDDDYVQVYGRINNERVLRWIKQEYLLVAENFNFYKIFIPKANGSGAIGEVLSTPVIGQPVIGHTQTFLSVGKFDTETEAVACLKYIKTKFCRAMLGTLKVTQDNPKPTWANVPLQDFTSSSDIDWSKSVAEIDQQLYAKYGLSEEEVAFIEKMVKPME